MIKIQRNLIRNILFSALTMILIFGGLETTARTYMTFRHRLNEYEDLIEHQGFTPHNKSNREKRLFIIGESAARGVPYALDTSFSGFLQKLLTDSGNSNVKVINTAIPGRHSFYQKEEGKTLVKYKADVVMIYAGNNDTRDFSNVFPSSF